MRFIEVHTQLNNCPILVNLDQVVSVRGNYINTVTGQIEIAEGIDMVRNCIKEINRLECKYDEYFDKHPENESHPQTKKKLLGNK